MKRFKIVFNRMDQDVANRIRIFFDEVSKIDGVEIIEDALSIKFDEDKEETIIALAKRLRIVELFNRKL